MSAQVSRSRFTGVPALSCPLRRARKTTHPFSEPHGLWEGIIDIPPPLDPPFDIETFKPIEPLWQAIREWIPDDDAEQAFDLFDQRPMSGKPVEIPLDDGYILVFDSD